MSEQSQKYHSITIGEKNTWDDWHLVPTSRPKFNMPNVKTNYVDIPGGDGVIDLTTTLTGRPVYGNRQGSFEFLVMNDYGDWYERYSDIAMYLHGKEYRVVLDDDPDWYYEGFGILLYLRHIQILKVLFMKKALFIVLKILLLRAVML